jgi:hypothetical protein
MQDEGIRDDVRSYDEIERDVLHLLTRPDDGQPLWSVEDIAREIEFDDPMVPVRGLLGSGLVQRTSDGFVFATRAGVRAVQMIGHVI